MELEQNFIEENQLNETQVSAINAYGKTYVESQKNSIWESEWSKTANTNAENIISGIVKPIEELTGIKREQGQKDADYLKFANEKYFEGTRADLERQKTELQEKIKSGGGDETLKTELAETKEKLSGLQQKEAQFDEWSKSDYKGKYEQANEKLATMEKRTAFNGVKSPKPESINKYEWDAKWRDWEKDVLNENNLVFDEDGEAWAVNKENEFKKTKLSELAKLNTTLQELMEERGQKGLGKHQKTTTIEGVPFKVPEKATPKERQQLIKDYLAGQKINTMSSEYSRKFTELNRKILGLEEKQA